MHFLSKSSARRVALRGVSLQACFSLATLVGAALTGAHGQTQSAPKRFDPSRSEQTVSAGAFGWFTLRNPVSQSGSQAQGTSSSAGLSAAYGQQLSPLVGYRASFSWTRIDEIYKDTVLQSSGNVVYQVERTQTIPANVFELSTTYVIQQPGQKRRVRAFAEAGPGVLMFIPRDAPFAGYSSYRAAAVYGAGAVYQLNQRWGVRLSYRGYFYKNPDFAAQTVGGTRSKYFTDTSGPAVSVVYRFR